MLPDKLYRCILLLTVLTLVNCTGFKWPGAIATVPANPTIIGVSSTAADDSYSIGAVIPILVTFSEIVNVTGSGVQLSLNTGSPAQTALSYSGGSGTTTLTFTYTVIPGNAAADLDYASTTALSLNGSTITGTTTGKEANTTLATPGANGSLGAAKNIAINTAPPTVASTLPAAGATNVMPCAGNPCTGKFSITFSKPMNTSLGQTLMMEVFDSAVFQNVPHTNTTFVWSKTNFTNDTLTVNIGWLLWPEMAQMRFTLTSANLQDLDAQPLAGALQQTFTTTGLNQSFPLTDTGQPLCYNNIAPVGCPVGGFPGQDADFLNTPGTPSFTGPTMHPIHTSDYTTSDNVTGLVWHSCNQGRTGATCIGGSTTHTWFNAINTCAPLNTANAGAGYAGLKNWRLPTLRELVTILNHSVSAPAISGLNFPNTSTLPQRTISSYFQTAGGSAYIVDFNGGNFGANPVATASPVRCVSPLATITTSAFINNGDDTVTDTNSNLRWQRCSRGQANDATCSGAAATSDWGTGLNYCDTLILGSHANQSNWRLPSIVELSSLSNFVNYSPSIDTGFFPSTVAGDYHAGTTYAGGITFAWYATFVGVSTANFPDNKVVAKHTRCVSTGP